MADFILFGNTLNNYFWFFLFIVIGFVVSWIVVFISKHVLYKLTRYTKTKIDDIIAKILAKPIPFVLVIVAIFFNIGFKYLVVSDWWINFIKQASFLVYVLAVTLFIIKFCIGLIEEYFEPYAKKTESKYDDQLIPVLKALIRIIFFVIAVLLVLSNLGYNISALLAGLGIGGLAIALASKDIFENFLSGVVIFLEKPFKIGDVLKTSDGLGSIEEIGIRSTKIRTFDNTLVVVPNKHLSSNFVENISARRARRENFTIGVTYSTNIKKLEKAKQIIIKILKSNKFVEQDSFLVSFESFGDFSLNIRIIYWIVANDYKYYLEIKDKINLTIKKEFEKEKIEFAFPTQTIHVQK